MTRIKLGLNHLVHEPLLHFIKNRDVVVIHCAENYVDVARKNSSRLVTQSSGQFAGGAGGYAYLERKAAPRITGRLCPAFSVLAPSAWRGHGLAVGKVIIKIASLGGSNPIVSALFFDPAP